MRAVSLLVGLAQLARRQQGARALGRHLEQGVVERERARRPAEARVQRGRKLHRVSERVALEGLSVGRSAVRRRQKAFRLSERLGVGLGLGLGLG